jgi:hypothetical protein
LVLILAPLGLDYAKLTNSKDENKDQADYDYLDEYPYEITDPKTPEMDDALEIRKDTSGSESSPNKEEEIDLLYENYRNYWDDIWSEEEKNVEYPDIFEEQKETDFQLVYRTKGKEVLGVGTRGDPSPNLGMVCILVSDDVYSGIETRLNRYVSDIENDTYMPYSVTVYTGSWGTPKEVRDLLLNESANDLVGAVLIGDIVSPWREMEGWGHEEFPSDFYYMDLDGTWIDADSDDKFDDHQDGTGDCAAEIFVGRLKPSVLGGNQVNWLNSYFDKNHDYRTGALTVPHRGLSYVDDDWVPGSDRFKHIFPTSNLVNDESTTTASDYLAKINEGYEFVDVMAHGSATSQSFGPNGAGEGTVSYSDISSHNSLFYNLFSCANARYTSSDCIGTNYVFTGSGMCALGSTKMGSMVSSYNFYKEIRHFKTIGEAFKDIPSDEKWQAGMALLGDPTLRISSPSWNWIVIEDQPNGNNGDLILDVLMEPGDTLDLYAIGCLDKYGSTLTNYHDCDIYATWNVTGGLDPIDEGPSESATFTPTTDHTNGTITISDRHGNFNATGMITVDTTILDHIAIESAPRGSGGTIGDMSITTDDELELYAIGYDSNNTYIAGIPVFWEVTGNLDSIPQGPSKSITFSPSTAGTFGTITIDDKKGHVNVTGEITVGVGALNHLVIESSPGGTGSEILSHNMSCDEVLNLYAAGHDADGNYISEAVCNWSVTGTLDTVPSGLSSWIEFTPATAYTSGTIVADDGCGHSNETGLISVFPGSLDNIKIVKRPSSTGIITIRPDNDITYSFSLSTGLWHYQQVNDITHDEDASYIGDGSHGWDSWSDIFSLEDAVVKNGIITAVKYYFRFRSDANANDSYLVPFLRLGETYSYGFEQHRQEDTYFTYSQEIPKPGGGPWTWLDINDLEIGVWGGCEPEGDFFRITQMYVEIEYYTDIELGSHDMTADDELILCALGYDSDDNYIGEVDVTWNVSGNLDPINTKSIQVTFSPFTAPTSGMIIADNGNGLMDATGTITVNPGQLNKLIIEDYEGNWVASRVLSDLDTLSLYARGYDLEGNLRGDEPVMWNVTGTLDPVPEGPSTTVNFNPVTLPTHGTITASASTFTNTTGTLTVSNDQLHHIDISPSIWSMTAEEIKFFEACGYDGNGSVNNSITITWDVNGGGTIDDTGLFTAEKAGTWTIFANSSGISGTAIVTVNEKNIDEENSTKVDPPVSNASEDSNESSDTTTNNADYQNENEDNSNSNNPNPIDNDPNKDDEKFFEMMVMVLWGICVFSIIALVLVWRKFRGERKDTKPPLTPSKTYDRSKLPPPPRD